MEPTLEGLITLNLLALFQINDCICESKTSFSSFIYHNQLSTLLNETAVGSL